MGDNNAVRVVVRIRPQIPRDIIDLCHVCTSVNPTEPQVWLGKDKAFTFDQVFDMHTEQSEIYQNCVTELVKGCFEGYNATVLAYGQTGSGKTYTMGTGFDLNLCHEERGIIPRAVEQLFEEISARQKSAKENGLPSPEFKINAQFMEVTTATTERFPELYNEEIIDLLDPARETEDKNKKYHIKIHEDASGGIYTVGVIAQCVTSVEEALNCLKLGSLSRTTASTGMNAQSSRSHAIFTLHIKQQRLVKLMDGVEDSCNSNFHEHTDVLNEFETLTAKFHFVDLAGSERLKRTRATGDRQKEGISINCGLLALGNVISALGDKSRKITHVPYRDSKLTRLLQDSLGGNSRTLMIACISPSDRDFMETLNTLKYANRAKNIKNKVTVNLDKTSQTINMLRQEVENLRLELMEYKQHFEVANRAKNIKNKVTVNLDKTSQTINMLRQEVENLRLELMEYKQGKRIVADDGSERVNDMYHENTMLQSENNTLKTRIKALQETVDRLTVKNSDLLAEKAAGNWISGGSVSEISPVIQGYIKEIETLRAKLMESEEVCSYLRKHFQKPSARLSTSPTSTVAVTGHYDIRMDSSPSVYELLEEAKEDVKKLKRKKKKLKDANVEKETEDDKESVEENEANLDEKTEGIESSSESEITEENDYSENLADLTCEISIKQKLIEQLEMSQRRLQNMRQHYEEKLVQLLNKIQETEKERNRVLSNLSKGTSDNQSEDKVKRVREEFEKKLIALQNDVKQMQAAKKEHAQMMKNQAEYERQLKKLKHELSDLKRTKVSLINKMKEETLKHKETEQRRSKEIAKLKKESRHKENQIKALEAEKKIKENILRRKQEEVTLLRRRNKPASDKLAGRLKNSPSNLRYNIFSPKMAKQKWQTLEKKINKLVLNKQSISTIEKDMERWLHEREKLSRYLEKAVKKRDRAMIEMKDYEIINEIEEEIENLKANIEYIHENIADCQTSIVQVEETKEDMDAIDINTLMQNTHIEESKYLLEKLLNMAISQSFQAAQRENTIKELEAQLKQVIENNAVQQQLLRHVIHQANEDLLNIFMSSQEPDAASVHSSRSESPVDNSTQDLGIHAPATKPLGKKKARNAPATPEQMLFVNNAPPNVDVEHNPIYECGDSGVNVASDMHEGMLCDPMGIPEGNLMRRTISSSTFTHSPSVVIQSKSSRAVTSSGSPPIYEMGEILPFSGRQGSEKNPLLICTHVAEGHDKAVLCIECTEDVLFSSSKDCTVKIWDLNTGQEIQKFSGHPEEVVKVRYCEYTRLAFTASGPFIKIWDVRENPSSCVRTLSSSGTTKPGHAPLSSFPKEHSSSAANHVNDIALNHYGTTLFSAAANTIRMWDLKMFESIGTLNGSQQSAVACLAVDDMGMDINLVISGSKDCSIKLFEVMEGTRGVHPPKWTLVPPHLDEIQSLVINGDFLFSGSKDRCIKKWDLQKHCCVKFLPEAHKDWVTSLNMIPSENLLLSACKSGYLKLWSASTCDFLEAVKAHGAPINCVTSNSSSIFTASDDSSVGMWKFGSASYGPDFDFLDDRIKY